VEVHGDLNISPNTAIRSQKGKIKLVLKPLNSKAIQNIGQIACSIWGDVLIANTTKP